MGSCLFCAGWAVGAELSLEPRESYVFAKDRIPGFAENRNPAESWLLNPIPPSWTMLPLDGEWKIREERSGDCVDYYAIDESFIPQDVGPLSQPEFLAAGYDFSGWKSIMVPLPLSHQKDNGKPEDAWMKPGFLAYYQRAVEVPEYQEGARSVFIKFFGAGFRTDVWVNGSYAGGHAGYFNPFEFDITRFVKPGEKASILVKTIHTRYKMLWHDALVVGIFAPVRLEIRDNLFVNNLKLSADRERQSIHVQYEVFNKDQAAGAALEAVVEEAKSGKVVGTLSQPVTFGQENAFTVTLDNPHEWSPDDPFLYNLKVKLDGKDANLTRFGFRTIEIKGGPDGRKHFYLNGKRFYMRAFEYDYFWTFIKQDRKIPIPDGAYCMNYQGQMRESLLAMKFANVNTLRPHSMELSIDETFLNLCDELGLVVYLDWHGFGSPPMVDDDKGNSGVTRSMSALAKTLPSFVEMLTHFHNHPSLGFISFGNEMYDHLLPAGESYDPIIEEYYAAHKATDTQNRPTSGSSGRPTYKHKAQVDFVDDHQYIGVYYGSYKGVVPYLKDTSKTIAKRFNEAIPFVNMETGYVSDDRIHQKIFDTLGAELRKEFFDKDRYIKIITGDSPDEAWARLAFNAGGVRPYYTDLPTFKNRKAYLHVKRYLEMFRMSHDITDGVSLNTNTFCLASKVDPDFRDNLAQPWPTPGELAIMEPIYAFRTAFYPTQAFLDISNVHILCGDSSDAPIRIVNDAANDAEVALVVQLRDPAGKTRELLSMASVEIKQGGHADIPFKIEIPGELASGKHVVEVYLLSAGKKIAENYYDIYTLAQADRITSFPTKKVALYDTADTAFEGLGVKQTKNILDALGIPYERIADFANLASHQVVIIGANSIDSTLISSGPQIFSWIANGGRLVMFEQCVGTAIPWSPDDKIYNMGKSSIVEHYYKQHEMFKGIEDEMAWESPHGHNAAVFENCLELNDSFLSLAAVAHFQDANAVKAIITDRRIGKGEYVLSMVNTIDRYNVDSTITRYVENLLSYILSDSISPYAVAGSDVLAKAKKTMSVNAKDAIAIDLKEGVNRGFADEDSGDKQGGWTDFGSGADLRDIPTGMNSFSGMVPFDIIPPGGNDGRSCIVLAGPQRDYFPQESPVIAVNRKCEKLYFLHTAMYVKAPKGEAILDYEITFEDGQAIVVPMKNQVDLADWWMASDYENAQVVYRDGDKCVFVSEWSNPSPAKAIVGIKAISKGNAIPIVLAITAKKRYEQIIDRTE
jgi:hypothetical protein